MAIRPIDVRRKEFKNGFRGYDANQVDDFLDQVADEFERAYTDNQRVKEEISSLRERLQQFEDLEGSIRSALVHAEQASNDLRNSAQREADDLKLGSQREAENLRVSSQKEAELIIQEAQARAHQMLADSSGRVERIQESYEVLVEAKREFKNDFRRLLKTYMDVMEDMEVSTAKGIESSLRNRLDTESMAVAREAAVSDPPDAGVTDDEGLRTETSSTEDAEPQGGPLYEPGTADEEASGSVGSSDETQRIDLSELSGYQASGSAPDGETGTSEDETGEVGYEGDTGDLDEAGDREDEQNGNGARLSQEEDRDVQEDDGETDDRDRAADEFFDRERREEPKEDNRIFRASRFLRRRG